MDTPWIKHAIGTSAQRVIYGKNGRKGNTGRKLVKEQETAYQCKNGAIMKNHYISETKPQSGNNDKPPQGITDNLASDPNLDI